MDTTPIWIIGTCAGIAFMVLITQAMIIEHRKGNK